MIKSRQRGIALVAVLWALVLLAVIAATVLRESRSQNRLARNFVDAAQAEALADGGVHRAIAGLIKPVSAGGWRVDGTIYAWRVGGGDVRIRIEDEGGKIDLNRTEGRQLQNLFLVVGLEEAQAKALTDAILDYLDKDDTRRESGAEDSDYAAAGLPHGAKNGPFEALEELHQVLGMTRETYAVVAPALTVHSNRRQPDRKVASPLVAAALHGGVGRDRDGADDSLQPPILPGEGSVVGETQTVDQAVPEDPLIRILYLGPTPHRSRVRIYTIHAEAKTETGGIFVRRAIVRIASRAEAPYQILVWDRGARQLFPALSR
jgi:general secretion pathway protein K